MAVENGDLLKKTNFAIFLNAGTSAVPSWVRQGKTTDNTITYNTETVEYDYVENESPTTEAMRSKPSLAYPLTMYKGDPAYEYIWSKAKALAVGSDAHTEVLVVFYADGTVGAYGAWKCDALLVIDSINPVDATISVNVYFNGTVDEGTAAVTDGVPVFTGSTVTEFALTITATTDGATPIEDATVTIDGVEKTTDASGEAVFYLIDGETYTVGAYTATLDVASVFVADDTSTTMTLTLV